MQVWVINLLESMMSEPGHPLRSWLLGLIHARAVAPDATAGYATFILVLAGWLPSDAAAAVGVPAHTVPDHVRAGQAALRADIRQDPWFRFLKEAMNG